MIEDKEIDLTVGHKFYVNPYQQNKRAEDAKYRITTGKYRKKVTDIFENIKRYVLIPWVEKANRLDSQSAMRRKRVTKAEDTLSNDFHCIIKSTSDNKLMTFGKLYSSPEVVEEVLLETIGYIPFTAYTRCMSCGKYVLSPHNSVPIICAECENRHHEGTPWQVRSRAF